MGLENHDYLQKLLLLIYVLRLKIYRKKSGKGKGINKMT